MQVSLRVDEREAGKRLDIFLSEAVPKSAAALKFDFLATVSRSLIKNWINSGFVETNKKVIDKSSYKIRAGDRILLSVPEPEGTHLIPESSIPLDIVYEDKDLLVINKAPGLRVHPGAGAKSGTLVNGLVSYLGENIRQIGDALRPGIVHRLDKDTSGLMVVAKNSQAFASLVNQFKPPRSMKREYLALTWGLPKEGPGSKLAADKKSGTISLAISRDTKNRKKMAGSLQKGKPAQTHWRLQKKLTCGALLSASLETGRTHQIRVHFAASGSPIVGDLVYGKIPSSVPAKLKSVVKKFGRQALHAKKLSFIHPRSGKELSFEADLPADMAALINELA